MIEASYPGDSNNGSSVSGTKGLTAFSMAAALTSPTPGSTLPGSRVTFTWTTGSGVSAYIFYLGTMGPGSSDLYNSQSNHGHYR